MLILGILAAIGIYLVCVVAMFLAGGLVYSVTLGAVVAPMVAFVIFAHRWTRRYETTAWTLVTTMLVTQLVIAVLAFMDSPSTATMWFH